MINRLSFFASSLYQFVYIFLTVLFLWFPIQFSGSFPITFVPVGICALAILLTLRYYISVDETERRINLLFYVVTLYILWVVISTGMHYWALNSWGFEADTSVRKLTVIKTDKYWVTWTLSHMTQIYLFFISLFLVSISIFRSTEKGWTKLTWIPLIFSPCLLVAFYQFYVDVAFLNNRPQDVLGGLGTDLSAFRISLLLIFPICVFTVIIAKSWWKKILYLVLAAAIFWLVRLSAGKTAIIGILLFAAAIPIVGAWVHKFQSGKGRRYLYVGLVWVFVLVSLTAIILSNSKVVTHISGMFAGRVKSEFTDVFFKGNYYVILNRTEMQHQAWRLIKLSPIAGWGPGGFLRNVDKIRFVNGDPYVTAQYTPNLYMDWAADLGLLGAGVTLFLYVTPLWMIIRIRKRIQILEERWAVGVVFATLAIMFLLFNMGSHTHFPEAQWIFIVYMGFLISVALKYGYTFRPIKGRLWGIGGIFLTILFIAGTYSTTFGSKGYDAIYKTVLKPYESIQGYYADYHDGNWAGEKTQWMVKNSVSMVIALTDIFQFKVLVPPRNSLGRDVLRLKIFLNEKILEERHFFKGGEYNLRYYLPGITNEKIQIRTELSQNHNPYRGDDFNFEGIVQPVTFMMSIPDDGIGFYPWEKMGKRRPLGWPQESKTEKIRWTGTQATMNISTNLRKIGIIYLMSLHPELDRYPVVLDILGDGRLIRQEKFNDYCKWRRMYFESRELKNFRTLTFRVNRTWNPLLSGFSDDPRDLGIYMIVPEIEIAPPGIGLGQGNLGK